MLRDPYRYMVRASPDAPAAEVLVQGPDAIERFRFAALAVDVNLVHRYSIREGRQDPEAADLPIEYRGFQLRFSTRPIVPDPQAVADLTRGAVDRVEATNLAIQQVNQKASAMLSLLTGVDLGTDRKAWSTWLADQMGYVNWSRRTTSTPLPVYTYDSVMPIPRFRESVAFVPRASCFGAGTPVHTAQGLRPIEALRVGDQVLARDPRTGTLRYRAVIAVHETGTKPTLRVQLEGESIDTTAIHRFWKAGTGWTMARDLRPGDKVRGLRGVTTVVDVAEGEIQPVYNLEVEVDRTFLIGQAGTLVHDFTVERTVDTAFDAVPRIGAGAKASNGGGSGLE
jgi:hypothetical protein